MWEVHAVFYFHWMLMILFFVACLSVAFKPFLLARLYVIGLLASQLIRNGCIVTDLENYVKHRLGVVLGKNEFIMQIVTTNHTILLGYKILFIAIIAMQLYEISQSINIKEKIQWARTKMVASLYGSWEV